MLQETHSTKTTETLCQKEWTGISFWNSGPTHQSARVVILFNEKFEGKIKNIINDDARTNCSISFTLNQQTFQMITQIITQSLTNYITSTQKTIIREDFNMVLELRDRIGSTICKMHLAGSVSLNKLINTKKLHDTWQKVNPGKTDYTYHRNPSNNSIITSSTILPFQYSGLLIEFALQVRTHGPGYWKLNTSILYHEVFRTAF